MPRSPANTRNSPISASSTRWTISPGLGKAQQGTIGDLFGAVSEENVARISRQNERKISVIIGNPPYNANQQNENDNNKNRAYPAIDARIKETYISRVHRAEDQAL